MTSIEIKDLSLQLAGATIFKDVSISVSSNELVALVGPNGAGKTSILQCALGLQQPTSGQVLIDGKHISELTQLERARLVSYLPQMRPLSWPVQVRDVIALGRYAYGASVSELKGENKAAVRDAIAACGLTSLQHRHTDSLSGGELARVHCARAFAAKTPLLLADEPVASLDLRHQLNTLSLFRAHVDSGAGALVVLHDISLAARFCDRLIWLKDGRVHADGSPENTVTPERLADIFDIEASVEIRNGKPAIFVEKASVET